MITHDLQATLWLVASVWPCYSCWARWACGITDLCSVCVCGKVIHCQHHRGELIFTIHGTALTLASVKAEQRLSSGARFVNALQVLPSPTASNPFGPPLP